MLEAALEFAGRRLTLLPERAVFDPELRVLLAADLHLGKADAIAATGVPMPPRAIAECWTHDLARLATLCHRLQVRHLYLLGDLLHARTSRSREAMEALDRFASGLGCPITLVRGNHDLHAGDPSSASGICCVDEPLDAAGLEMRHHPPTGERPSATLTVCGHIHPGIRISGLGGPGERAACFHLTADGVLTLPAFGSLTGLKIIEPGPNDRVWAVGPGSVIEVPASAVTLRTGRARRIV